MGIKRTPLDAVFSDLVRERADWTCEVCGKYFPDRKGAGLHCSHFWGRANKSTRWHGRNCTAMCFSCHMKLGGSPEDFTSFMFKHLGETAYDELTVLARSTRRLSKEEKKDMQAHFKAQLEYIRRRRREGEEGYIDFAEYYY